MEHFPWPGKKKKKNIRRRWPKFTVTWRPRWNIWIKERGQLFLFLKKSQVTRGVEPASKNKLYFLVGKIYRDTRHFVALEKARVTCLSPHLPAATSCRVRRPNTGGDTNPRNKPHPPPPGEPSTVFLRHQALCPAAASLFTRSIWAKKWGLLVSISITGLFSIQI